MDKDTLRKIQLTQLEVFKQVQIIAEENGIAVFLANGTLLGAVRHHGFIPWDDDLDLFVLRNEYDLLMKALKENLPEKYWVQNYDTDPQYWQGYAKVRKKGTLYKEKAISIMDDSKCGIWIDIFPLDYTKHASGWQLKVRKFLVQTMGFSIQKRILRRSFFCYSRRYIPAMLFWGVFPTGCLKKLQVYFMKSVCRKKTDNLVNIASTYSIERETYKTVWFSKHVKLSFEDTLSTVPSGYDSLLTQLYGDYMTPPPIENRHGHNVDDQFPIIV